MKTLPLPGFDHLTAMTEPLGLWEHALYTEPRIEHGFCTDDNARALIVICRQPDPSPELLDLLQIYVSFVEAAQLPNGGFHNRRRSDGVWEDEAGSDDSQGRAIWAIGTLARLGPTAELRKTGFAMLDEQHGFESPYLRANAFAVLGAAEALVANPKNESAREILQRCLAVIDKLSSDAGSGDWPWPEPRLTYDNARIPEALLAAGLVLNDSKRIDQALAMLDWLVTVETRDGHFSFTPVGGWALGETRPGFDQQPVEATAMSDACTRAFLATGDSRWRELVLSAAQWFFGANDVGLLIYHPDTGGSGDGLSSDSVNQNQGAESTLAGLAALQQAAKVGVCD